MTGQRRRVLLPVALAAVVVAAVAACGGSGPQGPGPGGPSTTTAPPTTVPSPTAPTTTAPPTTTTAPPATGPSGEPLPVGDLPGWRQVFTDDFTGTALDTSRWWDYDAGTEIVNSEGRGFYDSSRVVSVSDGGLHFDLHMEGGVGYSAVLSPELPTQSFGRYSVRFRSSTGAGSKFVWMTWPDSDVWEDGEINFAEDDAADGGQQSITAFNHYVGSPREQDGFGVEADITQWHTATMEWVPGAVRFFFDGELFGTSTTRTPTAPMHFLLQTEICSYTPTCPDPDSHQIVDVDWVSVYAYDP